VSVQVSVLSSEAPIVSLLPINPGIFAIIVVIRTFYPALPTLPTPKIVQQVQEV
jgi:hypothetical protein